GAVNGTTTTNTHFCSPPGGLDASGTGTWVRSKFDLSGYLGQRVRIRWIGATWNFGSSQGSYYETANRWDQQQGDDGWWLDDVTIPGAITTQIGAVPDTKPPPSLVAGGPGTPGTSGPAPGASTDPCNVAVGDAGTNVVLDVTDLGNHPID